MIVKERLDALTSLRFFAAAMIVIYHSDGLFGLTIGPDPLFLLFQGVSFFFVLSGFILTYVYPQLETWPEIRQFWRARIARIWPALLASFYLAYSLLSLTWDNKTALANLLMVNAWIPLPAYYFSYNSPSWSISTEFFFYLTFPFLIHQWSKTWSVKLFASGIILGMLILLSSLLPLSIYSQRIVYSLLCIHPALRIFEFIFGIFVASCWRNKIGCVQWSRARASLYELCAFLLVGVSMHFISPLAEWVGKPGSPASTWLYISGSMFAFGLLIYVIAIGRGCITTWLSHPIMVLLGEISFSLYLLHQILLRYYLANFNTFPHLPNAISFAIFWAIVLLSSYLMWALIEMPSRRLIVGWGQNKIHGTKILLEPCRSNLNLNRKTISAAAILSCLIVLIYFI